MVRNPGAQQDLQRRRRGVRKVYCGEGTWGVAGAGGTAGTSDFSGLACRLGASAALGAAGTPAAGAGGTALTFGIGGSVYSDGDTSADYNLYWNNADHSGGQGMNCNGCNSNTNAVNADPLLGSLGIHSGGGFTPYYAPGAGSAAIAAGMVGGCPLADQRDLARPQAPAACDIGSVAVSQARLL